MSAVFERQKPGRHPFVRKLSLHAALPQQAILAQLQAGLIADPAEPITLLHAWEKASQSYAQCGLPSRAALAPGDLRPVEGVGKEEVDSTLRRIRLYSPFDTHGGALYEVRAEKLITPQLTVNVDRAATRLIKPGMSTVDMFGIAFGVGARPDPVTRQVLGIGSNGGAVLFTSFDEDIRLHNPPTYQDVPINPKDDKSSLLQTVCFGVGGGCGFMFAYRVNIGDGTTRLILMNGMHRAYAMVKAGFKTIPTVVCDLRPMELPDPIVDLPKDLLLDGQFNPPMITDFLNEEVVLELDYFRVLRTVRFNWNFEQYATVLKE